MSIVIPGGSSARAVALPTPKAVLRKLPVVIREKVDGAKLPVQYEQAVKALQACTTIDEAKYFDDKAEALAAWAKVYQSDEAAVAARRLKLHAYTRIGELLLDDKATRSEASRVGMTGAQVSNARRLARGKRKQPGDYQDAMRKGQGVGAAAIRFRGIDSKQAVASDAMVWLVRTQTAGARLSHVRCAFKQRSPRAVAEALAPHEIKHARQLALELIEWLDEFEQALPKKTYVELLKEQASLTARESKGG